jgi:hypothetical protein
MEMIQAALKEEMTIPAGGIADFYLNDNEYDAFEKEEARKEFGNKGIAEFEPVAKKMASYGRFGDDVVIHAERGELVVPKELIDGNPKLKESIFGHLRELGVENPERYVVGSKENSLNPDTGMPEFFLKGLFKGVKNVFKSIGKTLKKVAPLVLPIALNVMFPGMGTVMSGALGAGLGTLIQGGDIKDAFKSALIGGATGALYSGAKSVLNKGTFMDGVRGGLPGAQQAAAQSTLLNKADAPTVTSGAAQSAMDAATTYTTLPASSGGGDPLLMVGGADPAAGTYSPLVSGPVNPVTPVYQTPDAVDSFKNMFTGGGEGRLAAAKDLFMPAGPTPDQVLNAKNAAYAEALASSGGDKVFAQKASAAVTADSMSPSAIRTFGPAAALAGGALIAGGAFDKAEEDPEEDRLSPEEYFALNPSRYGLTAENFAPMYATGPFVQATKYADGGDVFPRRNGGIMPNEGIPNQDSVRAMLMPGEFVMTTDAVKGLGGGSLNNGINSMYDMMRNLEARGKAFA